MQTLLNGIVKFLFPFKLCLATPEFAFFMRQLRLAHFFNLQINMMDLRDFIFFIILLIRNGAKKELTHRKDKKTVKKRIFSLILTTSILVMSIPTINADSNYVSMSFDNHKFSDVPGSHEYNAAFDKLYQLAILAGYGNNIAKPEDDITRAEMLKLIVTVMGSEYIEEAMISKDKYNKFSDIDYTHWASGYIAVGVNCGFISGHDDGTFAPEENITYYQAIKMILSILGYDSMAQNEGEYFKLGKDIGITEGIPFDDNRVINRSHAAQMISNALSTPIVKVTGYAADVSGAFVPQLEIQDKGGKNYATLLTEKHSAYVVKGRFKSSLTNSAVFEITESKNFCGEEITPANPKTIPVEFRGEFNHDFLEKDIEAWVQISEDHNYLLFAETV